MVISNSQMLRFAEMSRAYGNIERLIGGPQVLCEKFSQAERACRLLETTTVPHDQFKRALRIVRIVHNINNPDFLIVIFEEENFDLVLHHYKQALGCFDDNYYEPCNGEIRNVLEELLPEIYMRKTGKKAKNYYSAVDKMADLGLISHEERVILKDIKRRFNTNGSHPGRSSKTEAEYRLRSVTFLSRFLLYKIMNTPEGSPTLRIEK